MTRSTSLPVDLWTERDLAGYVAQLARLGGWLRYHTFDSRRSAHGFPDEVLVHPGRRLLLFRELKSADGKVRPEQARWLEALTACAADADLWRPCDLDAIEALLVGARKP